MRILQGDSNLNALELKNVTKKFGKVVANKNVNLTVKSGEILAVLGENGSGTGAAGRGTKIPTPYTASVPAMSDG